MRMNSKNKYCNKILNNLYKVKNNKLLKNNLWIIINKLINNLNNWILYNKNMENRRLSQNKLNDIQSDTPIAFSIGENSEDKVE